MGDEGSFSPDDLIAMAAGACLMRTFLTLAAQARVSLLSYSSTAALESAPKLPHVAVHSYLVAASAAEKDRLLKLFEQAKGMSPVCALLDEHVTCEADVRVITNPPVAS